MSVAILILAHKNEEQVKRLVNHLASDFRIYLHIDKKSKLHINPSKNIFVLKKRKVSWGSYAQIRATLDLLKIAYKGNHSRFILISGQDLPIKTNQEIKNFFFQNNNNYLEYFKLPRADWGGGINIERMSLFHFKGSKNRFVKKLEQRLQRFQKNYKLHRSLPDNLYGGANWINLTREAVAYIFKKSTPTHLMNYYFTECADEIYIQSILLNSELKKTCVNNTLRYVDWRSGPDYPRTLTINDRPNLEQAEGLFARKFDSRIDQNIIDWIYEKL
ncbi:beta-1,6-N-acetylglucosaminyltransferase [Leeuwenhoekiella sp. W20_SRS_FM14]|uniref:beta-1,6-N-acetylglucosaminyltransferase n=1 Tax=Leeuwenhoekiella sp. W20_SRS_FM14 TaxID=3240270 RepID=UPI003F9C041A